MRSNFFLFGLVVFIVSLIITLNIFFQQSYQSEMAEQFNRQQLLIAKSIARSIEADIQHLEAETTALARLLEDRGLADPKLESFVNTAYFEVREEMSLNVKVLDAEGRLKYSSFGESPGVREAGFLRTAQGMKPHAVQFVDALSSDRKVTLVTPIAGQRGIDGVLLVDVMVESINRKFLAPMRAGIRGYAWMMDSSGTLLYHPTQPRMVGKNLNQADASCFGCHASFDVEKKILQAGEIGFSAYIAPYGEDKLVAFSKARVGTMSWIVCVSIPYSEVTYSIRKSMRLHSLLVISIFLATLAGAFSIVMINRKRIKAEEKTKHLERQRSLEMEIVQAKDYLENILESTETKIIVLGRDFRIKTVNSAHERLCGMTKESLREKSFFDVFPAVTPQDHEMIRHRLEQALEGASNRISNYPYVRTDKTLFLNININPLVLHGAVEGIIISSSDVTEEVALKEVLRDYAARLEELVKERTDELLTEKEKLNAIVETVGAGIMVVDEQKRVAWSNRTLREWVGEENLQDFSLDKVYEDSYLQKAIADNTIIQEIVQHNFGRRQGFFQLTTTPFRLPDKQMQTLILIQDITDMKKMEERMMQSEKLSALARISAGIAHEIGNPLTSISSYVQILREMNHDEFTRESLETIARHISRIVDIVRQMASFSKTAITADLQPHDLRTLIDQTLDLVRYDKRMKHIRVTLEIPEGLPRVRVNETQCIQVFMNIVLNAADAMASEGDLLITAEQQGRELEVGFADTGPGIPAEHLEKIFDPFFTTKEKGTGLGLAVSYNIIRGYQGDILVSNRPEGGTLFKVRLPLYEN
ncbi:MAG: hypothetical protein OHK006_19510 [Thermodesulfovibrionales bacterium]